MGKPYAIQVYLMVRLSFIFWVLASFSCNTLAGYSSIVEATGTSCEQDTPLHQIKQLALTDARRNAAESVQASVSSYSKVENYLAIEDLIESYSNAEVKTLEVLSENTSEGCLNVKIRAEVTPTKNLDQKFISEELLADPTLPLTVKLWVDKNEYAIGEFMSIYVKANKPFYGRLIYTMNDGTKLQLLPNPYRSENRFLGQVLYTVPTAEDAFMLEVSPPVGVEKLTLYASNYPLGDIGKSSMSGMYLIDNSVTEKEERIKTRGIKIKAVAEATPQEQKAQKSVAEFTEQSIEVVIKQ